MTGYEGVIALGLDKALLSRVIVRVVMCLPVICLGVFTSTTWYSGAGEMASAA